MRIMPPAYDNVNFVGYTPEDVYDFINNKRPTSIAVYTLSPDVTDATDWVGAAKKHKADMEEDIDRKTFERLKEKFGDK